MNRSKEPRTDTILPPMHEVAELFRSYLRDKQPKQWVRDTGMSSEHTEAWDKATKYGSIEFEVHKSGPHKGRVEVYRIVYDWARAHILYRNESDPQNGYYAESLESNPPYSSTVSRHMTMGELNIFFCNAVDSLLDFPDTDLREDLMRDLAEYRMNAMRSMRSSPAASSL